MQLVTVEYLARNSSEPFFIDTETGFVPDVGLNVHILDAMYIVTERYAGIFTEEVSALNFKPRVFVRIYVLKVAQ